MLNRLKSALRVFGSLLLLLLLAIVLRLALLPFPLALIAGDWTPPAEQLDARQVTRTEYFRGFFQPSRSFDQALSRAILAVLQDSLNFGGDTTPDFNQLLVYYDADGRVLGYTDLDVFDDGWLVTYMEPGGFRRGGIMHGAGRQQLLRFLGFTPPFTRANLRRQ